MFYILRIVSQTPPVNLAPLSRLLLDIIMTKNLFVPVEYILRLLTRLLIDCPKGRMKTPVGWVPSYREVPVKEVEVYYKNLYYLDK